MSSVGHNSSGSILDDLILDEIRAIVAAAIESRSVLWVAPQAERLAKTYAAAGLSKAQIAYEITIAASKAKVLVHVETVKPSQG